MTTRFTNIPSESTFPTIEEKISEHLTKGRETTEIHSQQDAKTWHDKSTNCHILAVNRIDEADNNQFGLSFVLKNLTSRSLTIRKFIFAVSATKHCKIMVSTDNVNLTPREMLPDISLPLWRDIPFSITHGFMGSSSKLVISCDFDDPVHPFVLEKGTKYTVIILTDNNVKYITSGAAPVHNNDELEITYCPSISTKFSKNVRSYKLYDDVRYYAGEIHYKIDDKSLFNTIEKAKWPADVGFLFSW